MGARRTLATARMRFYWYSLSYNRPYAALHPVCVQILGKNVGKRGRGGLRTFFCVHTPDAKAAGWKLPCKLFLRSPSMHRHVERVEH